jgi:two-component system, LytTR family, sensor kinase
MMLTPGASELLHVIGFLTGIALYAMLLAMVIRAQPSGDRLMVFTAFLGLGCNVGEIGMLAFRSVGLAGAERWTAAASYTALGFLAAVVVHSVARGSSPTGRVPWVRRTIVRLAYACSGVAGLAHLNAAATGGPLPSFAGLALLTGALLILAPALVVSTGPQGRDRRALWMIALAIFAVSAVHLSRFHGGNESWATELVGHHASIPLAFAILYQDYRFALADLFLKQALTLIALVAIVSAAWSLLSPAMTGGTPTPITIGTLLVCWVGTALAFPWIRRGITTFVDRVVLARADYAKLVEMVNAELQQCDREVDALERTCAIVGPALSAQAVSWVPRGAEAPRGVSNEVAIPTADDLHYVLKIGTLLGGRRLLSDDLAMLDRVAFTLARRIDVMRLTEERYQRELHDREMRSLATEAELRALRAQVNPHFLFNTLTTVGYLIQSAPPRALKTLFRLTALLRTVLRSEGEFTTLGRERDLIDDYLSIERERFEERLRVELDIPDRLLDAQIPPLIVQPLVENAIKHGIAGARSGGVVAIRAWLDDAGGHSQLVIQVRNTGAPLNAPDMQTGPGVGLRNVNQRLRLYYDGAATLTLESDPDGATVAELRVPSPVRSEQDLTAMTGPAEW